MTVIHFGDKERERKIKDMSWNLQGQRINRVSYFNNIYSQLEIDKIAILA